MTNAINYTRTILLVVLSFLSLPLFISLAYAQATSCYVTKVGNPAGNPVLPSECATMDSGYIPPTTADTCTNKYISYVLKNYLLPKNYGDPVCDYSKNAQYQYLKQQDPTYANLWFFTITPGESGYNPNAWAPPVGQQAKLDKRGAWGIYQMGSSNPPGNPPPAPGKNGPLDRGDVNWQIQTTNAIGYNRNQHCGFRYWATARSFWGKYSC